MGVGVGAAPWVWPYGGFRKVPPPRPNPYPPESLIHRYGTGLVWTYGTEVLFHTYGTRNLSKGMEQVWNKYGTSMEQTHRPKLEKTRWQQNVFHTPPHNCDPYPP